MATVMEIYPTVLSVAGVEVPENHVLDGSDPYEHLDMTSARPDIVKRLCHRMKKRLETERALYPMDKDGKTLFPVVLSPE